MNVFDGVSLEDLLAYRNRLRNRLINGSQTRVAVGAGLSDEFAEKTDTEIRRLLLEVNEALNALDPETYPLTAKRMKIMTQYE